MVTTKKRCIVSIKSPEDVPIYDGAIFYIKSWINNCFCKKFYENDIKDNSYVSFLNKFYADTPFFTGGNIGELTISDLSNEMAVRGAKVNNASISFVLQRGYSLKNLKIIVESIQKIAERLNIQLYLGDLLVQETATPVLIHASAIGIIKNTMPSVKEISPGDYILASGDLGKHEAAKRLVQGNSKISFQKIIFHLMKQEIDISSVFTASEGLLSTLQKTISTMENQIEIDEKAVPISLAVQEMSQKHQLDPLDIDSTGRFLCFVKKHHKEELLSFLQRYDKTAAIIGKVGTNKSKKISIQLLNGKTRTIEQQELQM